jgi:hypothetical protein
MLPVVTAILLGLILVTAFVIMLCAVVVIGYVLTIGCHALRTLLERREA